MSRWHDPLVRSRAGRVDAHGLWPGNPSGARICPLMDRRYWHHCGQLLSCVAVAFLLAAHEKLCTLPVPPPQHSARHGAADSAGQGSHSRHGKPRRPAPTLTERAPDCSLPRRIVRNPQPLRRSEWTQRERGPDGSSGPLAAAETPLWRVLGAAVRPEAVVPDASSRPSDRRTWRLFRHLIARHGPPTG